MKFSLWLESLNIRPIEVMNRQHVMGILNAADASGKNGKAHDPSFYDWMKDDQYYLIDAPTNLLDTNWRVEGETGDLGISGEALGRVQKYMAMSSEPPPIILRFHPRAQRRGAKWAAVVNGSHRVEAAVRKGLTTIRAIIPKSDFERWTSNSVNP